MRITPLIVAFTLAAAALAIPVTNRAEANPAEQVIQVTSRNYSFKPKEIKVKKGVPVVLELTSLDRMHGVSCPGLGIRSDIPPKKVTKLRFVPEKTGTFPFHCDNFCGKGHQAMGGTITVTD